MFLRGTFPANVSLISVCRINIDKLCAPGQETNVIAIFSFYDRSTHTVRYRSNDTLLKQLFEKGSCDT